MKKNTYTILSHAVLVLFFSNTLSAGNAGTPKTRPDRLTRPVIRGRSYAVSSMRPESTQVAERILRAGGNAFDCSRMVTTPIRASPSPQH